MTAREGKPTSRGVFLVSRELGCPVNLSLTTRLHNYVTANGWALREADAADYIVIASCSTLPSMRESVISAVEYFATRYPSKKVIVTCCFVKKDMVEAPNVFYVPLAQRDQFDTWFDPTVPLREVASGATVEDDLEMRTLRDPRAVRSRPYNVLVSAGCLNHCAFCIGKSVFPTVQSVPIEEIVAQCQEGLRKGYTNFVIGASDIGSYGVDIGAGVPDMFSALFTRVFRDRRDLVVGFKGFEPSRFIQHFDALKDYFRSGRIDWLCLPIQSGSNDVLKAMNRKYRVEEVIATVKELRQLAPSLRIETDLIYCFPTETAEDFDASLKMLEHFDHVQALMFQRHENTAAGRMQDVFTSEERTRRQGVVRAIEAGAKPPERPECRSLADVSLPSRNGAGFAVLKVPG